MYFYYIMQIILCKSLEHIPYMGFLQIAYGLKLSTEERLETCVEALKPKIVKVLKQCLPLSFRTCNILLFLAMLGQFKYIHISK